VSATSTLAGSFRALRALRRRFTPRIERFQRRSAVRVRSELVEDPHVREAVRAHVASTGESEAQAWARVHAYAREIVPSFSLVAYYRLGYLVARALIPLFYRVTVGYEAREALSALPRSSSVVYLMNHRSNADYVLVAFVLSGEVAVSYAVGEWARVWPLETLFKSFGSYFVRRGYPEPLYHKVLERYVQLITRHGVTQGIFIEGGLSRDGRFRAPKLGLLDNLVRTKLEAGFDRPLAIIPVAINYDRVLEDRSLLRELQAPEQRLPRIDQIKEVLGYLLKVSARFLLRRARRYGRACVNFGAPLRVDDWLATNPGVLLLPREQRLERLKDLADEVMGRIAAVMPVTSVALACAALLRHEGETISRERWQGLLGLLRLTLKGSAARVVGEERSNAAILDRALVMLTMRHVVAPEGAAAFRIDRGQEPLLRYYANSIAHLLEPPAGPA
jgi:glycerol-3-phosphate O-acyltransferase